MNKLKNIIVSILYRLPAMKNFVYSVVINALRYRKEDIPAFLRRLQPYIKDDPDKYVSALRDGDQAGQFKFRPDEEDKYNWIKNMNIKTVLDVGAWKGSSVQVFHDLFPEALIHSFEPLSDCFDELQKLCATIPALTAYNFGLGDKNERMQMNRSEFSPSSSLLKMDDKHKEAFPFSAGESTEEIEIKTMDSVIGDIAVEKNVLMKIDVQGFEENVLVGAKETLKSVKIIIIELAFVELYQGQPGFDKIYRLLLDMGFDYAGSWRQSVHPKDGQVLQQDAVFIQR